MNKIQSDQRRSDGFFDVPGVSSIEQAQAGILPSDSKMTGQMKLDQQTLERMRTGEIRPLGEKAEAELRKTLVALPLSLFAIVALIFGVMWLTTGGAKSFSLAGMWQDWSRSRELASISEQFSSYSTRADWPNKAFDAAAKFAGTSTTDMYARLSSHSQPTTQDESIRMGATLWERRLLKKDADLPPLAARGAILLFLRSSCTAGIPTACLDAANGRASGLLSVSDDPSKRLAEGLSELPTAGNLANNPSIIALRKKLNGNAEQINK